MGTAVVASVVRWLLTVTMVKVWSDGADQGWINTVLRGPQPPNPSTLDLQTAELGSRQDGVLIMNLYFRPIPGERLYITLTLGYLGLI